MKLLLQCRRLERHWTKTGKECDRLAYRQSYRSANELINKARQAYFSDRIANLSVDPRKRWAAVKELLHTSDKDKTGTDAENRATCDLINAFFADKLRSITESLRSKLVGVAIDPFAHDLCHQGSLLTSLPHVMVCKVHKMISSITSKSSPTDYVPTSLVKACPAVFAELITYLVNLSFCEGCFPQQFKKAQVTHLKREELDTDTPANYRPISNLNTIFKKS